MVSKDKPAPRAKLVLASGSARRMALLQQIGIEPDALMPADIDETPQPRELPRVLAARLAAEKASVVRALADQSADLGEAFVLAADTVVCIGRRILPKCEIADEAEDCLRMLSGRAHRVYTGVTLITPRGSRRHRLVETRVRFKRLGAEDLGSYLASGEWRGKAGGYAIQGLAGSFVAKLVGSYSSVVGLPLHETQSLLVGEGYGAYLSWRTHK